MKKITLRINVRKKAFNFSLFFASICLLGLVNFEGFADTYNLKVSKKNKPKESTYRACTLDVAIRGVLRVNCANPTTVLTASSSVAGVTFSWTGPSGFVSNIPNPTVSVPGYYVVKATDPANGCTVKDSAFVNQNFIKPTVVGTGGTISCAIPTVTLRGFSNNPSTTFAWTGPGGFTSNIANPVVSVGGVYTVTGTASNGCSASDTAVVKGNTPIPNVTAVVSGIITCTTPSVTLLASSTTPGVIYNWTGPGGFTSNNPVTLVSAAGTYTVKVTDPINGCSSTASVVVNENTIPPVISVVGATITCSTAPVVIVAQSPLPTVTYSWTGPGGFTANIPNPVVTIPGTYNVTATNPATGCTSAASVSVLQNITNPAFTIVGRRRLNCANPTTVLTATTATAGALFSWTGPGGFTSNLPNPTISGGGLYNLTVTDPANGCSKSDTAFVNQNFSKPPITTTGGTITCLNSTVTITASSSNLSTVFTWTGPGGFTATGPSASVSTPGVYAVSGIAGNGCTNTATATVNINTTVPVITATGGTITCANPTVTIAASSATPGVTYSWTGPGGFTSNLSNPTVTATGTYVVTVADPANGCSSTAIVVVDENTSPPAISVVGATITCSTAPVIIVAQSPLPTVAYSWTGPGGFAASIANPVVTIPGTYNVTATNPATGCTSTASVLVPQNTTKPAFTIVGRRRLNCANPTTVLTATTTTVGALFSWTGPGGFISSLPNPTISGGGLYNLTVTDPANGCSKSDTAFVNQNFSKPPITTTGGTITCVKSTVTITASSSNLSTVFTWTGPGGFTATGPSASVSTPGVYTVSGIAGNGCTNTATATVNINTTAPAIIATGGTITCANPTVTLAASSATPGVTYSWTGPGGFTSNLSNPTVSLAGTYVVIVADPANGCLSTASVVVNQNTTPPAISVAGATITCSTPSVILVAQSASPISSYSWTGPGGFTSTGSSASVSTPGVYIVLVIGENGCTDADTATVNINTTVPDVTATGGTITCANPNVILSASSTTPGVTFAWTGPEGFTSYVSNPVVAVAGTYVVTVIDSANGCSSVAFVTVDENTVPPVISATGATITCTNSSVIIAAQSTSPIISYSWTGPDGFTATGPSALVSTPGVYTVSVIGENGCTNTATATVNINTTAPSVTATGGTITCANSTVTLASSSTTPGVTYSWTGPGGYTSNDPNPTVAAVGTYVITVTDPANGCSSVAFVVVDENTVPPAISVSGATITCSTAPVIIVAQSPLPTVAYSWTGPGGFTSNIPNPVVTIPGTYNVTAVNISTGCTSAAFVVVLQNTTAPTFTIVGRRRLNCTNPTTVLTATTTTAGAIFSWTGPGGFTSNLPNPTISGGGLYNLTVINPANGCATSDTAFVNQNFAKPPITTTGGAITCANSTVTITASSSNLSTVFSWTGPGGFTATGPTAVASVAGVYTVSGIAGNGCTNTATATVNINTTVPNLTATGGTITCTNSTVTLVASSTTPLATFAWTGPGGFTSNLSNPIVSALGTYVVTATNPASGCTKSVSVVVNENKTVPPCSIQASTLTPKAGSTQNLAGTSSANAAYSWSLLSSSSLWKIVGSTTNSSAQITVGPAGTQATFTLVVTNKLSGCKQTCQITLTAIASHSSSARMDSNEGKESKNLYALTYANPFSEQNSLIFSALDNFKAKIELYTSTTGEKVETLFENKAKKDEKYNLLLRGNNMPSGLYIIRLTINQKIFQEKIILKR